jgi:serine/threonine-protein kinase
MKLKAGVALGPYRIVEELGRGGMGAVYKAYQPSLDRFVAIKVLPTFFAEDERLRARFKREAITIAQLTHPAILPVYEFGQKGLRPYIVMALAEGGTLGARAQEPLSVEATVKLLAPLAEALDYAHRRGVLHRDVKPGNVLLQQDGRPLLSDFGLARSVDSDTRLTQSGAALGTPDYMAPELWRGEPAQPASDQFSLAVMCHELLTGRLPFPASTVGSPRGANAMRQPDLSQAPARTRAALARALAKSPKDRFPTCAEFVHALIAEPVAPIRRRGVRLTAIGVAAAVAVALVATALVMRPQAPPAKTPLPRTGPLKVTVVPGLGDLKSPSAVAVGPDGSLYIADTGNNLVKKVDPAGRVSVFAGGGTFGMVQRVAFPATLVALHSPSGVAVDPTGNVFIADTGSNRIVKVDPQGGLTVYAGDGIAGDVGDDVVPTSAELSAPTNITVYLGAGPSFAWALELWIIDQGNNKVKRVNADGHIITSATFTATGQILDPKLLSSGSTGFPPIHNGANWYLSSADANQLFSGSILGFSNAGNCSWVSCMRVVAGTGEAGFSGDGGEATRTTLNHPGGIAVNRANDVYIADTGNNRIRLVDHSGIITTVAGGGSNPNSTKPLDIKLNAPVAVVLGADGTLYITDTGNNRILKLAR